jgi:transcription elongation factor Elf1
MIIWGWKTRTKTVCTGNFHCPSCERQQSYTLIKLARWFTLYFIPLFKTKDLGEYVECGGCKETYKTRVLGYQPATPVTQN